MRSALGQLGVGLLLLKNDQRILWRTLCAGRVVTARNILSAGLLYLIIQLPLWVAAAKSPMPPPGEYYAVAWAILLVLMISAGLARVPAALFDKKDMGLVLLAPIPLRTIYGARLAALALTVFLPAALVVVPAITALAFNISPGYATGYLVWGLTAVVAAAVATIGFFTLERLLGFRAARLLALSLPAFVAGFPMLVALWKADSPTLPVGEVLANLISNSGLGILGYAAEGHWDGILGCLGLGAFCLLFAAAVADRCYLASFYHSSPSASRPLRGEFYWRSGMAWTSALKEWRLLRRHAPFHGVLLYNFFMLMLPGLAAVGLFGAQAAIPIVLLVVGMLAFEAAYTIDELEQAWAISVTSGGDQMTLRVIKAGVAASIPVVVSLFAALVLAIKDSLLGGVLTLFAGGMLALMATWLVLREATFARSELLADERKPRSLRKLATVASLALLGSLGQIGLLQGHEIPGATLLLVFVVAIVLGTLPVLRTLAVIVLHASRTSP